MNFLVTGGAGYIGSFMTKRLLDDGHKVTVIDNLVRGHRDVVDQRASFQQGDLLDKEFLTSVFSSEVFDGVFHFAGLISVAESMQKPGEYFMNNQVSTIELLDVMVKHNVTNIIFSSTAAVYGNPKVVPIPEDHPKSPESPYGESKLMVESILSWYQKIHGINYVALRYFNAAGAALDGSMGENHTPESHIIPNAIKAALQNQPFILFGSDYNTPDGTCVRDYIHVLDLAEAHVLAFEKLTKEKGGYSFNVGTGNGYSNQEVVNMVSKMSGQEMEVNHEQRRPGDPAELVANVALIKNELGFTSHYSDLETIVSSAWKWHAK